MAKGLLGSIVIVITLIVVGIILFGSLGSIQTFITNATKTKEEKDLEFQKRADEQRKSELGLFDNIAEFFFGKPTEDTAIDDKSVSKGDFDQNTDKQKEKADREKRGKEKIVLEASDQKTPAGRDISLEIKENLVLGESVKTATVVKPKTTVVVIKPSTAKKPTSSFSASAGGLVTQIISPSGSRIEATSTGLKTSSFGSKTSSSSSSKGSSASVSDTIKTTVIKGKPQTATVTKNVQGSGNLSTQSIKLNTKGKKK